MRRCAALLVALAAMLLAARVVASAGHSAYLPILHSGPPAGPSFPGAEHPTAPAVSTAPAATAAATAAPSSPAPGVLSPTSTEPAATLAVPMETAMWVPATPTRSATPAPPTSEADALARVVELINSERTSRGLAPVARHSLLDAAAQGHSEDMAAHDLFSHTGSDGSTLGERLDAVGYSWSSCGEIIAAGYTTPESAVQGWMESDGHRGIILTAELTEIGVGHAYDADSAYRHYWTADFATP